MRRHLQTARALPAGILALWSLLTGQRQDPALIAILKGRRKA